MLPAPRIRILEVGCGHGDVAARLHAQGFQVTPLDSDPESVRLASTLGLQVVEADFLRYEDDPYDVVLFTRSLHHIHPLSEAVARAHALLKPGGLLVCEEFARERADSQTASWFFDMRSLLEATGVWPAADEAVSLPADPLERWRALHAPHEDHPLHTGEAMLAEVQHRFERTEVEETVYLYRYLAERLEQSERGYSVARNLLEMERHGIAQRWLVALGLRLVAQRDS